MVSAGSAGREAEMADWVVPVNVVESGTATMRLKATNRSTASQDAGIRERNGVLVYSDSGTGGQETSMITA
jgi:hypothetical protein